MVKHLRDAREKLAKGEFPGVFQDCYKALEGLDKFARLREVPFTKTQQSKGKPRMDLEKLLRTDEGTRKALNNIISGTRSFPHEGARHIGTPRMRQEAEVMLMSTHGILNLLLPLIDEWTGKLDADNQVNEEEGEGDGGS